MASTKRLNSVAHSIAHHAVSGLSYLHPHLSKACEAEGATYVEIDLLAIEPCPVRFRAISPVLLSIRELKNFYLRLLESEGFNEDDLTETRLLFSFDLKRFDHYCSVCTATLKAKDGKVFEKTVDYMGNEVTRASHNLSLN